MKYYAKTNTADPAIGFITVGEYLTDKQAEALGEDKLRDMVRRGVLKSVDNSPREAEPPAEPDAPETPEPETEGPDAPEAEPEDAEDELPTLDAGDVIDDEPPAKPKRGGRKAK